MCGITVSICHADEVDSVDHKRIKRRGPNGFNQMAIKLGKVYIEISAAVLSMRGSYSSQPLADSSGNITAFNGEIFNEELVSS